MESLKKQGETLAEAVVLPPLQVAAAPLTGNPSFEDVDGQGGAFPAY